jgi:serine phosphatase RsbU (regulator of sigma subunit)/DNA-binding response OmpR family regulator
MANETILVVEDEVLVGEEIREELERFGYRVPDIIVKGEAVVDAVSRHHPSLILMDIRIGGEIDGIEAAARVKASEDIPIIYLTAYSDQETLARAADTDPDAYLLKPFSERELMANVSMSLSRPRSSEGGLRQFEPFLAVLNVPGILVDTEGRVKYANQLALTLIGYADFDALRGMELTRILRDSRLGGDHRILVSLDGSEKDVVVRAEPVETAGGKVLGCLMIIDNMDAKERRHMEISAADAADAFNSRLPASDAAGPGYTISGFLLATPAGSGDLYDVFNLDADRFAFYALDVMGHGMLPSLFAFSLHDVVRLLATRHRDGEPPRPSELVEAVNRRYSSDANSSLFFTLVYGDVDRKTGKYRFVRAGHPPLIHVPRTGEAYSDMTGGPALGAFSEATFNEGSGVLEPGDRIIICSDGLLQGKAADVTKGLTAFLRVAEIGRSLEPRVFAASVKAAALGKTGSDYSVDDSSMLVIHRLSEEAF